MSTGPLYLEIAPDAWRSIARLRSALVAALRHE